MKIDYILLNIIILPLFLGSLFLESYSGISWPRLFIGSISLFLVVPFTLLQIFPHQEKSLSLVEKYFIYLTIFFFLYVPFFFIANRLGGVQFTALNILSINTLAFISTLILTRFKSNSFIHPPLANPFRKEHLPIITAIFAFAVIHLINYHFYRFMPEMDGYADLERITHTLQKGTLETSYRGFFTTSAAIISMISGIDPYTLFTTIFIGLQSSLLLVLYRIARVLNIKNKTIESFAYLIALSIPALNMEIDTLRPQSIVVIFLPILIYFLYRFFREKNSFFLIPAIAIGLFGLNYHEIFIFPLAIYSAWFFIMCVQTLLKKSSDIRNRIIFLLLLVICGLVAIIFNQRFGLFDFIASVVQSIFSSITEPSSWRLWFLNSYSDSAGNELGWPGVTGAAKYYAYYLSPILATIAILFASFFVRFKKINLEPNSLLYVIVPMLAAFLCFAEILPRLGYFLFPERSWLLIDILFVLISIPLLQYLFSITRKPLFISSVLFIACSIGIAGSFYIAANKKSFISDKEYEAALWIKQNTPENSIIITQPTNKPMITIIAQRRILAATPDFFLSEVIMPIENRVIDVSKETEQILKDNQNLLSQYFQNEIKLSEYSKKIQDQKLKYQQINQSENQSDIQSDDPKYILYSFDKFKNIYQKRQWWRTANAYGADLEKFDSAYQSVYQDSSVYIWKVR